MLKCAVWVMAVFILFSHHAAAQFIDLKGHPARHVMENWLDEGLLKGYDDGTVRPDATVTRAEFAAMIQRVFPVAAASSHVFTDTPQGSWYLTDVQKVHQAGLMQGYPDGSFRPHQRISRQEAAMVLMRLAGLEGDVPMRTTPIGDLEEAAEWSRDAIRLLAEKDYIDPAHPFRPKDPLTRAEAVTMLDRVYTVNGRIGPSDVTPLFTERFDDKQLAGRQVQDADGRTIWNINEREGQTIAITPAGQLELGGAEYMQLLQLQTNPDSSPFNDEGYAVEFTLNLQKMTNEGHSNRPMIVIIPRTKDADYKEYYAVIYYVETMRMGAIVANLFQAKWAIVNTAAPSGTEPLATGHFLLRENIDYTARLTIENTDDDGVHIAFYLDGPSTPQTAYKPVVSYTDRSPYRIKTSAAGPAFGMSGKSGDFWGHPPTVRFDDIRFFSLSEYETYAKWLKRYASAPISDMAEDHPLYNETKYLVNRGLIQLKAGDRFEPNASMAEGEFAAMLAAWSGDAVAAAYPHASLSLNKAADMIYRLDGQPEVNESLRSVLREAVRSEPSRALAYLFEQGMIGLDDSFRLYPSSRMTRAQAVQLFMRYIDEGYRLPHGKIKLPSVIQSGAVLQRDKPIPIWGTGTSGETITVQFRNQTHSTRVVDGYWEVVLDPEPYGGPDTLTVTGAADRIVLTDILVGEVFVVAGQSNAEMSISEVNDAEDILQRYKDDPNVRYYFAKQILSVTPRFDDEGYWTIAWDWAINYSSAIGTFFMDKIKELRPELEDVPVGIIRITYGGSTIELFLPEHLTRKAHFTQHHDEPIISGFWNAFMETVSPYAVRLVMYYQGENSTQLAYSYEPLLRAYLGSLREKFRDPALPVFLVQLAGYGDNYYETDIDSWPIIREIQMRVANTTPNTELVTAVDLADPNPLEIHPRDKRPISERIAYRAADTVYGDGTQRHPRSSEMSSITLEQGRYVIQFRYVNGQLALKEAEESGFEILNEQGKWLPAEAQVAGDALIEVWREDVTDPQGVRYAWRNYPTVTVFDSLGLPALPFNSAKDLHHTEPATATNEHYIRILNHFLDSFDAIVNLTRDEIFRMVEVIDGHLLWHEFAIPGQSPGDKIAKFKRSPNRYAEEGTSDTIVRLPDHGLKEGDWIRNNTRLWIDSRVIRVFDAHTFEIEKTIPGQSAGDELELYRFQGISSAVGAFE